MTFPKHWKGATDRLVAVAEAADVPYMLIGAAAVARWGFPRATHDVDFTLAFPSERSLEVDAILERAGFERLKPVMGIGPARLEYSKYWFPGPSGEPNDGIGVDVFYTTTEWQHEAMGRRVAARLQSEWAPYYIASKEDLLIYKVAAFRLKDVGDLEGIMERQYDKLDWNYIQRWARELGILTDVEDLVEQYQIAKGLPRKPPWGAL